MINGLMTVVLAYVLGAIPFGYLLVKWRTGKDVRGSGSGNIGATNVLRTTGPTAGVATLVLDIGKGYLAVWLAGKLTAPAGGPGDPLWMGAAALAVMAGHSYPVFLRFHGGKAVASFVGAFACLTPLPMAAVLVVFLAVVWWTRRISMGSIVAAAVFPLGVWLIQKPALPVVWSAVLAGAFIIYRHRSNIERLNRGTEPTFRLGSGNGR